MTRKYESATERAIRIDELRAYVDGLPKHTAGRYCHLIDTAFEDPSATVQVVRAAIAAREARADAAAKRMPPRATAAAPQAAGPQATAKHVALPASQAHEVVRSPYIDPRVLQSSGSEAARLTALDVFEKTIALAGHSDLIAAARLDGVSTPQDVAARMLARERERKAMSSSALVPLSMPAGRQKFYADHHAHVAAASAGRRAERETLHAAIGAHMVSHPGTSYAAALEAIVARDRAHARRLVSPRAALHADAQAYRAAHPGVTYSEALKAVQKSAATRTGSAV